MWNFSEQLFYWKSVNRPLSNFSEPAIHIHSEDQNSWKCSCLSPFLVLFAGTTFSTSFPIFCRLFCSYYGWSLKLYLKRGSGTGVFSKKFEFPKNFKKTFFIEHFRCLVLIGVLQIYFKQRILKESVLELVKNEEITYPDEETRRNEVKWENLSSYWEKFIYSNQIHVAKKFASAPAQVLIQLRHWEHKSLPFMHWMSIMLYTPSPAKLLVVPSRCSTKPISKVVPKLFKKIFNQIISFH